jgi:hypothetical protein
MSRTFFFSGLFPSPHAPGGWIRGMIFLLILLASRHNNTTQLGLLIFLSSKVQVGLITSS